MLSQAGEWAVTAGLTWDVGDTDAMSPLLADPLY